MTTSIISIRNSRSLMGAHSSILISALTAPLLLNERMDSSPIPSDPTTDSVLGSLIVSDLSIVYGTKVTNNR
jgi:hypothetical protein